MELIPSNTAIFSPQGFRPWIREPGSVVEVTAGSVWGRDDVARLRTAGLVRMVAAGSPDAKGARAAPGELTPLPPGAGLGKDDLAVRTALWLALAGVPVEGGGLDASVRDRLDPTLLDTMDRVTPASVIDLGVRELLSLELRRRARTVLAPSSHHPHPPVAVLLPEVPLSSTVHEDLAAQTWPEIVRCPAPDDEVAATLVAQARRDGALYCTRLRPDVRYGPHHLADLVHALRHSGARVAHSPMRFRPWRQGSWLEDDSSGIEGSASGGLPGGSLWYAVDGPVPPPAADGYAVHGANAVPVELVSTPRAAALRLHLKRPDALGWLAGHPSTEPSGRSVADPVPRSYFAVSGTPSRARSASTASES